MLHELKENNRFLSMTPKAERSRPSYVIAVFLPFDSLCCSHTERMIYFFVHSFFVNCGL